MTASSERGGGGERLVLRLDVGHESVQLSDPHLAVPGQHTHRWTIFVRGPNETALDSQLVQKIIFSLHEDFPNPKRVVTSSPFEVSETGYGGFNIPIYIYFTQWKAEHYLEYDMNLKYEKYDKNKQSIPLTFDNPKQDLRARLIKAGAEVHPIKTSKSQNVHSSNFNDVFGKPLRLTPSQPNNEKPLKNPVFASGKPQYSSSVNGSSKNSSKSAKQLPITEPTPSTSSAYEAVRARSPADRPPSSAKIRKKFKSSKDINNEKLRSPASSCSSIGGPMVSENGDSAAGVALATTARLFNSTSISPLPELSDTDKFDDERLKSKISSKKRRQKEEKDSDFSNKHDQNRSKPSTSKNSHSEKEKEKRKMEKSKRKKTKSDSGLDSDYSGGCNGANVHSPAAASGLLSLTNGHHSGALFSPPDSVQSADTASQESPPSFCNAQTSKQQGNSNSIISIPNSEPILSNLKSDHDDSTMDNDNDRFRGLVILQQKIMTIRERHVAQSVADIISEHAAFRVTGDNLEFDLCTFDGTLIQRLLRLFESGT